MFDGIAPGNEQKFLLALTAAMWSLWFMFDSPEKTQVFLSSYGIFVQPGFDMPSLFSIAGWIWALIIFGESWYSFQESFHSDCVITDGIDSTEYCVSGRLHIEGSMAWVRTGGIKMLSIEGSNVLIGMLSHIHRVGTHLVFECLMVPHTRLMDVPGDLKEAIRQRRDGVFGVTNCSVGYLSDAEIKRHREFKADEFAEFLDPGEKGATFQTSAFIRDIRSLTRSHDLISQLNDYDPSALRDGIKAIAAVGDAVEQPRKKSVIDRLREL